jgi:uncharacterized protein (TIGR02147 family)
MSFFELSDYKKILKNFLKKRPGGGRGEYAKIARHLKVHSSLVSQVLAGEKNFSPEQLQQVTAYLGMNELESEFSLFLLERERAGTKQYKDYWQKKIEETRKRSLNLSERVAKDVVLTDAQRAVFYSSWIYSAVRIFTSLGNGATTEQICDHLALPRKTALEVLAFLVEARLVIQEGGLYKTGPQRTHLEFGSPFLVRHHTNWRLRSIAQADFLSREELMFTGPLTISRADFAHIREELTHMIQSVSERVKHTSPEDIACLNIDWIWLRKPSGD